MQVDKLELAPYEGITFGYLYNQHEDRGHVSGNNGQVQIYMPIPAISQLDIPATKAALLAARDELIKVLTHA